MPFAPVNGIELYYEDHGDGPAVLFAHGQGGNHLSWWQQVPVFQRWYRCITFDHRAFGSSRDAVAEPGGRMQFVPDAVALLDYLGIDRCFIVAHSMGGRTGAGLVRRVPARVRGAVFSGTPSGATNMEVRRLQQAYAASLPPGSTLLQRALRDGYEREQPGKAFLYREIQRLNPRRPADFLAPPPGWTGNFTAYIAESGVPVLYLVGEDDAVTPARIVEKAAGLVRGARFQMLPGAGHSSYFETPDAFSAAVLGFLRELEVAERR
ncbi:MAG: alpha/beta fold hydrolase [Dehalococcoidia bacterium]